MRTDVILFRSMDADLIAIKKAGYSVSRLMARAVTALAHGRKLDVVIDADPESIIADTETSRHRCAVIIDDDDTDTVELLRSVRTGYRSSFLKAAARDALSRQQMYSFFDDTDLISGLMADGDNNAKETAYLSDYRTGAGRRKRKTEASQSQAYYRRQRTGNSNSPVSSTASSAYADGTSSPKKRTFVSPFEAENGVKIQPSKPSVSAGIQSIHEAARQSEDAYPARREAHKAAEETYDEPQCNEQSSVSAPQANSWHENSADNNAAFDDADGSLQHGYADESPVSESSYVPQYRPQQRQPEPQTGYIPEPVPQAAPVTPEPANADDAPDEGIVYIDDDGSDGDMSEDELLDAFDKL